MGGDFDEREGRRGTVTGLKAMPMVRSPSPAIAVICAMISSFIWSPSACAKPPAKRVKKQQHENSSGNGALYANLNYIRTCVEPSLAMYDEHRSVTISDAPLRYSLPSLPLVRTSVLMRFLADEKGNVRAVSSRARCAT